MPYLELSTQAPLPSKPQLEQLLSELGALVAEALGKSPAIMMACARPMAAAVFAESPADCCYVSIRGIGSFEGPAMTEIAQGVSRLLEDRLKVANDRVFIVFDEVERTHWGVRGSMLA